MTPQAWWIIGIACGTAAFSGVAAWWIEVFIEKVAPESRG